MRSFHFPGRSPVYGRRAMCATSHPAGSLDGHRDPEGRRQRGRCGHRHRRRAGRRRMPHDGDRRRLLRHRCQARQEAHRAQCGGTRAQGCHGRLVRKERHQAHRDHQRACRDRARRRRRLVPAARGSRQHAARSAAGARHRAGRARLRRRAARLRRLGATASRKFTGAGAKKHLLQGRPAARGRRGDALSGARRHPAAHRQGWPRRLLPRAGGQGHGGRAQGAGRPAHARRLCRAGLERQLRRADLGRLSRPRPQRAAAQQPGHRRADHAQDAGAARQAGRRSRLARALSRADGGGAARLCHARYLRRRPRHGRRAGRAHARRRA